MDTRLHIGNISNTLADNTVSLNDRLGKFGKVIQPLEIHTKPNQTHSFGFITINLTKENYIKLKKALHNVLFMGMKLSISKAKPDFQAQWAKDHARDVNKRDTARVQVERTRRIQDASLTTHVNSHLQSSVAINLSTGYSKSPHTYNNISGNVKNSVPTQTLIGAKSYGSLTAPSKYYDHASSKISGGGEIIRGRIRKTPRSNKALKDQTLRILVNGNLKSYKCHKTKLWGIEKNKTVNDLTWQYNNGAWKSGDNHVIERVTCAINASQAMNYGKDVVGDIELEHQHDSNNDNIDEEKSKSLAVLANMFGTFDFDKPVNMDESDDNDDEVVVDTKGRKKVIRFDYEVEGERNDNYEATSMPYDKSVIDQYKQEVERPRGEVYYDEDDEGNELDLDQLGHQFSTENISKDYYESHKEIDGPNTDILDEPEEEPEDVREEEEEQDDDEQHQQMGEEEEQMEEEEDEEEFIPSFGTSTSEPNNTEALRTLFNPKQSTFSLAIDTDDIDETNIPNEEDQKLVLKQIKKDLPSIAEIPSKNTGLFWYHGDSAFLQTQTQLSKLGFEGERVNLPGENDDDKVDDGNADETPYEQWFWKMRGEISRECKRRRRDVVRILKKKSSKSLTV